jgi:hypothetical protein
MYWIDPDGIGIGDGAIYVHCDMKTGEIVDDILEVKNSK